MQNRHEVIISIKPKWCDLIVSGLKIDEIRKTKPDTSHGPLRVFIYRSGSGNVIGEFTLRACRYIQAWIDSDGEKHLGNTIGLRHCLKDEELFNYLYRESKRGKPYSGGWAWRIENLIVYDDPRRLDSLCGFEKPPQSWRYGVYRVGSRMAVKWDD